MAKTKKGTINPKSLQNLKTRPPFEKGNTHWQSSIEPRKKNGELRRLTLAHLNDGEIELPFKKVTLYKKIETEAGTFQNIEVKADFDFAMVTIPNMNALSLKIIEKAMRGDPDFVKIVIEMDENYKNRQIDIQNKAENTKENLIDHIQRLTVMPIIKDGDDEVPDYASLGRQAE